MAKPTSSTIVKTSTGSNTHIKSKARHEDDHDGSESVSKHSSIISKIVLYSTEPDTELAKSISKEIKIDKDECRSVIATYGVDKHELLHLLERWTQHLIGEFKQQRERFKVLLKGKWDRRELQGITSFDDTSRHDVYEHMKKLKEWVCSWANTKSDLESLQLNGDLRGHVSHLTNELRGIMKHIISIYESAAANENDRTRIVQSMNHLSETVKHLEGLHQINEKEYNTLCIIGLEKAGKSSFINAILGFELLPTKLVHLFVLIH
jgi:ribosome biogenesis GTPase A